MSVTVKNTGAVHGAEVVQLYLGFPPSAGEPPQVLRGFKKLQISPGAEATATFKVGTGVSVADACACACHHESASSMAIVLKRSGCMRRTCLCGTPRATNGHLSPGRSMCSLARRAAVFCLRDALLMRQCSGPRSSCSSDGNASLLHIKFYHLTWCPTLRVPQPP